MSEVISLTLTLLIIILAIGAYLQFKDELIKDAEFDQHWEEAQALLLDDEGWES